MSDNSKKKNDTMLTARTAGRHNFGVPPSRIADVGCGVLALLTTLLLWFSGAI
ncbi:MAG: hypothetical protein IJY04_03885 [Clostridia bacterium]|nr:hypothetical protein [Clostridia bacterium]